MITAQVLRDLPDSDVAALLEELGPKKTEELQHNWEFWARPEQLEPEGIWNVWLHLLVVAGVKPVLEPNGSDTGSRRAIRLSTVLHLLKAMFAGLWSRVTQGY